MATAQIAGTLGAVMPRRMFSQCAGGHLVVCSLHGETMAGPYLQAALLCERVLVEKDETVSAVRIVDRVTAAQMPTAEIPVATNLSLLVMLKFGDAPDPLLVEAEMTSPVGQKVFIVKQEVVKPKTAPGGLAGANVFGPMLLPLHVAGIYTTVVRINAKEVTRIFLELYVPPAGAAERS